MNNYLEQFSEERLKKICDFTKGGVDVRHVEIEELARIALSVKQANPVAQVYQPANIGICAALGPAILMINVGLPAGTLLYTTPQPAHTEKDGWKLVPIEMTDDIGEAIAKQARCCGGIALDIYDAALAAAPKPDGTLISEGTKNDSCQWNPDEDSVYSTGCGNEWQFTEGGLEDNQIKFCPYCSGKIAAAPKPEIK